MKNKRIRKFLAGKGFYIALILCVAVVGVGTWAVLEFTDMGLRVTAEMPNNGEDVFNPQTPAITLGPNAGENPGPNAGENPGPNAGENPGPNAGENPGPNAGENPGSNPESKPSPKTFMWPVSGDITMPYSMDALIYSPTMADWRTHEGLDIASDLGTAVSAIADGTVVNVENGGMQGTSVTIEHGGDFVSVYANLETDVQVGIGDEVEMGDIIGRVGDTSIYEVGQEPHLHLEMTLNGANVNPLDYLPQ